MEDGVVEAQSLLHPREVNYEEEDGRGDKGRADDDKESRPIEHILSNLVSKGEATEEKEEKKGDRDCDEEEKGGGGILDHLISTLVSPLSPKAGVQVHKKEKGNKEEAMKVDEESEQMEAEEDGGAGIIDNLVARFPSLPDDAVPTTDEASILIHSIVHD